MKSVNYRDLKKNSVLESLNAGDIIEGAPTRMNFIGAINQGYIESRGDLLVISAFDGYNVNRTYMAGNELEVIHEALKVARGTGGYRITVGDGKQALEGLVGELKEMEKKNEI